MKRVLFMIGLAGAVVSSARAAQLSTAVTNSASAAALDRAGLTMPADVEQVLFVKRLTYSANHYYTEFINSAWRPGGNLCVLDVRTGKVRELLPDFASGVFERYDLSFDARRVVFAWKKGPQDGYRLYEVNVDGTGLRQLTFPQPDEADLVRTYRVDPLARRHQGRAGGGDAQNHGGLAEVAGHHRRDRA